MALRNCEYRLDGTTILPYLPATSEYPPIGVDSKASVLARDGTAGIEVRSSVVRL